MNKFPSNTLSMVYISAQPDNYYFLWQLQLQLFNFNRLGIDADFIHVLICYDKERGLSQYFQSFIEKNKQAKFFTYSDTRKTKLYDSSLRPHIIKKHFKANLWLEDETIFYHDSDIIFTQTPDFDSLLSDNNWYASDTRYYTNSHYIKDKIGAIPFKGMAKLMEISPEVIEQHDENMGGAQYLLKKLNFQFWQRLEIDCEKVYEYLNDLNNQQIDKSKRIQAWCTDMWCLWWQAIRMGKKVKIHPKLDFMWAHTITDDLPLILHYTGNISADETRFFRKNNYGLCSPMYDDFSLIEKSSASSLLVDEIKRYNQHQLRDRIDLNDVSFLIPIRIDSEDRLENLIIVTNYLNLKFKTKIIVLEADSEQKVNLSKLPDEVEFHFVTDDSPLFHRTKYNNQLIALSKTPYVSLYDTDVILPVDQILKCLNQLRKGIVDAVYPYDGRFLSVDILMKNMFGKLLDEKFLELNKGKHSMVTCRSYAGCVFLNKQCFILAGGENENLNSWGPYDIERKRRMQSLGCKIERIEGNLYHLAHPKSTNSRYPDFQQRTKLMNEYFKVCSMPSTDLKNYINTWPWKKELANAI